MARFDHSPDLTSRARASGAGLAITWRCMGCNMNRPILGSTGLGLRKRCGACVSVRAKGVAA